MPVTCFIGGRAHDFNAPKGYIKINFRLHFFSLCTHVCIVCRIDVLKTLFTFWGLTNHLNFLLVRFGIFLDYDFENGKTNMLIIVSMFCIYIFQIKF